MELSCLDYSHRVCPLQLEIHHQLTNPFSQNVANRFFDDEKFQPFLLVQSVF